MKCSTFFSLLLSVAALLPHTLAQSWFDLRPEDLRDKINQKILSIEAPTPEVFSTQDLIVQNQERKTPVRLYTPKEGNHFPVILLIHGGAWVAGNIATHDNLARYLCAETQAVVISVDYANSPEGKYPLPLEQCYDALNWIAKKNLKDLADPSKIAVVGDSAGGNMAAALCLMVRDRNGPKPLLQVLINPALDLSCNGSLERKDDPLDTLRYQAVQYLSNPDEAKLPYVSPLLANDLSRLPPALVILAEKDDLREGGQQYAHRLSNAEVPTQVFCQKDIGHLAGDGARASLRARESLDVAASALRKAFSK